MKHQRITTPRTARQRAAIRHLIQCLQWLDEELEASDREYWWLKATDAATHVWPDSDDLHEAVANLRHDLNKDEEGFPLTDMGDHDPKAERTFIPYGGQ